ncbi:MAG: MFS transporter [Bacteroidales bacterium]|jgi:NNP family nitrate/nitrite transporter-like MFS transporter|nr:MFS transporter [Bacteroidales bacterium]NCU36348.1 MFS transporter [Candidatus Falkowbacteria bacterium]MDD2633044.1 MFS transporter [Bacteroidales bacterium]MDD3525536.1 MFS transporter [Bacteroidales bacterium]MDD4177628.1 MFS transporter [Bacteroidales bacterium]
MIKLRGNSSKGLAGTTLGFFFGFAAVALYGPTAIIFKEAMSLTPAELGLLIAVPTLTGSLLRIPFGAWVDTTGGKIPFLILMMLSVVGLGGVTLLLFTSYPEDMQGMYGLVLFFGMLSGCGIATFSVGIGQTSYWFPRSKQGMALGTYAGLGNLAPGIFSLVLPIFLTYYGFISAYFAWFLFLLLGTILYGFIGQDAYYFQYVRAGLSKAEAKQKASEKGQELFPTGGIKDSLINSAKVKNTWALVVLYFTTFGGFIALTAWFPTYWNEFQGFEPVKAGLFTAIFSILASAIRVPGGSIADRFGGERIVLLSMGVILMAAAVLSFAETVPLSMVAVVLLAAGMGVANAAVFKLVPVYVSKAVGGAAGWVGGLGAFGGFALPPIMGAIAGKYGHIGYARGFIPFVALALINVIIIWVLINNKNKKELLTESL